MLRIFIDYCKKKKANNGLSSLVKFQWKINLIKLLSINIYILIKFQIIVVATFKGKWIKHNFVDKVIFDESYDSMWKKYLLHNN